MKPLDEVDPYFRLCAWAADRVLSKDDIADLQQVLADYNSEIEQATYAHSAGYDQAREECARADVAELLRERDSLRSRLLVEKAMHKHTQILYEQAAANAATKTNT